MSRRQRTGTRYQASPSEKKTASLLQAVNNVPIDGMAMPRIRTSVSMTPVFLRDGSGHLGTYSSNTGYHYTLLYGPCMIVPHK